MRNVTDIINSVNDAWGRFNYVQLEKAFCTLTMVYDAIICCQGDNNYVLPHLGKDTILREEGVFSLRAQARQASPMAVDYTMEFFLGDI